MIAADVDPEAWLSGAKSAGLMIAIVDAPKARAPTKSSHRPGSRAVVLVGTLAITV
jgi:hypothetical protein